MLFKKKKQPKKSKGDIILTVIEVILDIVSEVLDGI